MLTADKQVWMEIENISRKMLYLAKSNRVQVSSLNDEEFTCKSWLDITDLDSRRMTLLADFFNSNKMTTDVVLLKEKINNLLALDRELIQISLSVQNKIRQQSSVLSNQYQAAVAYESIQTN